MASRCGYPSLGVLAPKQSPNQQILKQGQRKLKKINSVEIFMEATWIEIWQLRACQDARHSGRVRESLWGNRAWGAKEQKWRGGVFRHNPISKRIKMEFYFSERNIAKGFPYMFWRNLPCLLTRVPRFPFIMFSTLDEPITQWVIYISVTSLYFFCHFFDSCSKIITSQYRQFLSSLLALNLFLLLS